ncbi:serine/threonine-protein phosphatase 4 regulatory subunit 1 isoform X2 [Folsomia candida]|uniref:serine/threonine-protein phosphatase 4 regulatory subunit 1 isoform X2 n=1 Tax=Folsomia candida TaxID=158441 RepID=UPI001604AFE4|nr:serine/threonine-protein phosphatase 4 regulatory subunit 1 isoform X2 [Folsomia candida]
MLPLSSRRGKSAAQDLLEAFRQTSTTDEDVSCLIDIINKLAVDTEYSVRAIVMEQLPQIALFCHEEGPHLDHVLPQHILPHVVKLLTDKFTQVRKTSQAGLLLLVERGIIAPSQVEEHVVPIVMEFTMPVAHEDYRTEITQFMSKLAPLVGKDITINWYLDRFCHLCHDKLFQVRKVCASSIGEMATVVGINLTEHVLVSHFRSLCQDEVWGVRKGCAETITVFSSCCKPMVRKEILTKAFVELLQDSSRWVRVSACQSLGPFITTFVSNLGTSSVTTDCSEAEKSFLSTYKAGNYERETSTDSLTEYERRLPSLTPTTSALVAPNSNSTRLIANNESICEEGTVDQNQNTKGPSLTTEPAQTSQSTDFSVMPMPMDIDDVEDSNFSEPKLYSTAVNSVTLSFEEKRRIAYEQNGNEVDAQEDDEDEVMNYNTYKSSENSDNQNSIAQDQSKVYESSSDNGTNDQSSPTMLQYYVGPSPELDSKVENSDALLRVEVNKNQETLEAPDETTEYDTWQYWRDSIPEIDLNVEVGKLKVGTERIDAQMEVDALFESGLSKSGEIVISMNTTSGMGAQDDNNKTAYIMPDMQIHRSYMNLFNATSREQAIYGFESLKLGDAFDDDDDDEQLNATYSLGDEYSAHSLWGNRNCRPRLLTDLPKTIPVIQDIVPEILLENFTALCQQSKDHQNTDSEILSFCVYNFPAVVLTLGPQNWSLLRDCYEALACNVQWKIRYTLASSLHEIAGILGPELSERDLVPFYNATTKDLDEVRIGILRNLASFIKGLGGEAQRKCLETLDRFAVTENNRNWRFRLELADQIKNLSEIYEAEEIFKVLCPLTMDLLLDRVAEVRKKALSVIPYLVTRLNYSYADHPNDPSIVKDFLEHLIKTLGYSDVWVRRQAFATLAGQLVEIGAMSPPQFAQNILPPFLALSKDKVPNVRLKVGQSIVMNILHQEYFADPSNPANELLQATLIELQEDDDRDVRYCSQFPDEDFECTK